MPAWLQALIGTDRLKLTEHSYFDGEADRQNELPMPAGGVSEEQLFYLMSRGLSEEEATTMVVSGFIEPLVRELPMEYAVEMNRLVNLEMEGSVG